MRDEDQGAMINCQFCNDEYHFDATDLDAMIASIA
ncbi:MAG: hypothetical protein ACYS22_04530 [Planctomycetota bacterium]|jgi:redox-regulated HSP33 family molecular chaperone